MDKIVGIVIAVLLIGFCGFVLRSCSGGSEPLDLTLHFEEKDLLPFVHVGDLKEELTPPYLNGKVIVLFRNESGNPMVDPNFQRSLPADVRALSAEEIPEIGTVVWIKLNKDFNATYTVTVKGREVSYVHVRGYTPILEVSVIDYRAKKIIAKKTFRGGPPPARFTEYVTPSTMSSIPKEVSGEQPSYAIVEFLQAMPRKQ